MAFVYKNILDQFSEGLLLGKIFYAVENLNLGASAIQNYGFTTDDVAEKSFFSFNYSSEKESDFEIFEGSAFTGGTALPSFNKNRNSSKVAKTIFVTNPTITNDGLSLTNGIIKVGYTGRGQDSFGGEVSRNAVSLILKRNTSYLFRVTSLAADNEVSPFFSWVEDNDS